MKVLIVDGSRQQRANLVDVLSQLTNVVVQGAVADVRTALRAVVDAAPDVVVTSVLLPDGDGTDLILRLRSLARAPSIVVVTPVLDQEQTARYLAAGADACVEPGELERVVARLARPPRGSIPPDHTLALLGRMTSAVVHDLNNYVGVLELMLTLLRRDPSDAAAWAHAHAALDAIRRLDATLLEYARGGAPDRTPIDLGPVVRDIVGLAGRVIPDAVTVTVDIADERTPVSGVRSEIEQLVLNLVVNACDAMPRGGELTVTVRRVPHAMLLEVGDTGDGGGDVPVPVAGRVRSSKPHGTGLGLGIVHAVVERHAGAIRIVPRPRGTMVAVAFPTARVGSVVEGIADE